MSDKKAISKERTLLDTLKQLIQTEEELAKCERAHAAKTNESVISNKINEIKAYLEKQARRYKKASRKIDEITAKYQTFVKDEKERYEAKRNKLCAERETCQVAELDSIALYKKTAKKIDNLKGTRAYEKIGVFRTEIQDLERAGKKKKAVKKVKEFNEYKAQIKERIKALETEIATLTNESQMDNDSERKLVRAEMIEQAARRLRRTQKLDYCAELDSKLDGLKANIYSCRVLVEEQNRKIKKADKNYKETLSGFKIQEEAEKQKASKQTLGQKIIGRAYLAISDKNMETSATSKPSRDKIKVVKNDNRENAIESSLSEPETKIAPVIEVKTAEDVQNESREQIKVEVKPTQSMAERIMARVENELNIDEEPKGDKKEKATKSVADSKKQKDTTKKAKSNELSFDYIMKKAKKAKNKVLRSLRDFFVEDIEEEQPKKKKDKESLSMAK